MRKFLIAFIILALCQVAGARTVTVVTGQGVAAAGCTDCSSGCTFLGNNSETNGANLSGFGGLLFTQYPAGGGTANQFTAAQAGVCELSVFARSATEYKVRLAITDSITSSTANVMCQTEAITVGTDYAWKGGTPSGGILDCDLTTSTTYYIVVAVESSSVNINTTTTTSNHIGYRTQATAGCPSNDCIANGFPATLDLSTLSGDAGDASVRIGYK